MYSLISRIAYIICQACCVASNQGIGWHLSQEFIVFYRDFIAKQAVHFFEVAFHLSASGSSSHSTKRWTLRKPATLGITLYQLPHGKADQQSERC